MTDAVDMHGDCERVWVNDAKGSPLGRFDQRNGWIYRAAPRNEAIDAFPRTEDLAADWKRFVDGMLQHHGVNVPDMLRPIR